MPTPAEINLDSRNPPLRKRLETIIWIAYFKGVVVGIAIAFVVLTILGVTFEESLIKYYLSLKQL